MKSKEVLEILGITRQTLTKYVKTGIIKIDSEINGRYIYNDESVYELLKNKKGSQEKPNELIVDTLENIYEILDLFAKMKLLTG
jgi:predicted site-specific integrase-resolvase